MEKIKLFVLTLAIIFTITMPVEAATTKVMWGEQELKPGQIGRLTILKKVDLYKVDLKANPGDVIPRIPVNLVAVRELKPGGVLRVYSYRLVPGYVPFCGVGAGLYVFDMYGNTFKYETPSKAKLLLANHKVN